MESYLQGLHAITILKYYMPPLYQRIARNLIDDIRSGKYQIDEMLPTEEKLCQEFGVSRYTARGALRLISESGLIIRRQGLGSTVIASEPQMRYEQSIGSIDDLIYQSRSSYLQFLEAVEVSSNNNAYASQINIMTKRRCICVRAIRYPRNDVRPLALHNIYVAVRSAAMKHALLDKKTSINQIIKICDPTHLDHIDQVFSAVNLSDDYAKLLHVEVNSAAFQTIRHYYDGERELVALSHALYRGQTFTYSSTLSQSSKRLCADFLREPVRNAMRREFLNDDRAQQ